MRILLLASLILFCCSGLASAAKNCGKFKQRPCKLWERVPACKKGLYNNKQQKKCLLRKDRGKHFACGKLNQKPCKLRQRIRRCDKGLYRNLFKNRCLKRKKGFLSRLLAKLPSKSDLKKPGNHKKVKLRKVVDPKKRRGIEKALSKRVPKSVRAAARKKARKKNVITMVGFECHGAVIIGFGRDCAGNIGEMNYPDGKREYYIMNAATLGVQLGAAGDVTWTTIKANAAGFRHMSETLVYDFYVAGVSIHAGIGFQFQVIFDKHWKAVGTKGGPGIGLDLGLFVGVLGHLK